MIKISPSILAADYTILGKEAGTVEAAGADFLHIDVMDGHFVPVITFGAALVKSIRAATKLQLDVHLMIDKPSGMVDQFIEAGAGIITFHLEAEPDPHALIRRIRAAGVKPSVSIRPGTSVQALLPYLDELAMVLIMTVEPGFGGQKLIGDCLKKAELLRRECRSRGLNTDIEADGGIHAGNITAVAASGVNVFVAGSAVFGAPSPAQAVKLLRENAAAAGNRADMPWLF